MRGKRKGKKVMRKETARTKNRIEQFGNAVFLGMTAFFVVCTVLFAKEEQTTLTGVFASKVSVLQPKTEVEELGLYAVSAAICDAEGRLYYGKNEHMPLANASTTKIMTCIVALELGNLEDEVVISHYAESQPPVKAGLKEKEVYLLGDLLAIMMLESYNDAAVAVAEHIAGSTLEFAALMNEKASELGMTESYFITPNGLDAEDAYGEHQSSAYDLCLLGGYALKNEVFQRLITTRTYTAREIHSGRLVHAENKNRFLDMVDGAAGIKTGYTSKAGYCFVGAASSEEELLITCVLGSGWPPHRDYKWEDTRKLIRYVGEHYQRYPIENRAPILLIPYHSKNATEMLIYKARPTTDLLYYLDTDSVWSKTFNPVFLEGKIMPQSYGGAVYYYCNEKLMARETYYLEPSSTEKNHLQILEMFLL